MNALNIDRESKVLLSVGELNNNKNHSVIIKALAKLNDENIHYIIVGEGPLKNKLIKLAERLNVGHRVHLLGYRNDISKLMNCADVFCFPSKREGLSVSLMEAMACGLPIVASKIRGNIDLVVNEKDGKLVLCDRVHEYIECINEILQNKLFFEDHIVSRKSNIRRFSLSNVEIELKRIYKI